MNDLKKLPTELLEFRTDAPDPSAAWLIRTRHRVAAAGQSTVTSTARPRWTAIKIVGATAAIGVIGAVTVGLLPISGNDNGQFGSETAAAAVLLEAADNARNPVAGPTFTWENQSAMAGKYIYSRERRIQMPPVTVPVPGSNLERDTGLQYREETITESWSPAEGKGTATVRHTLVRREAVSPAEELKKAGVDLSVKNQVTEDKSELSGITPKKFDNPFDSPTPARMAALPTDPDQMLAVINRRKVSEGNAKHPEQQLVSVADLMGRGDALLSPEQRKALFVAASKIRGITKGEQVDLDGRTGVAIGVTSEGFRREIIVDQENSRVLGYRYVAAKGSKVYPKGTVIEAESVSSAIVDKPGQTQ